MDSNPINEGALSGRIEATEDVEGHGKFTKFGLPEAPSDEDVEGHGIRISVEADEDDAEGHAIRAGG